MTRDGRDHPRESSLPKEPLTFVILSVTSPAGGPCKQTRHSGLNLARQGRKRDKDACAGASRAGRYKLLSQARMQPQRSVKGREQNEPHYFGETYVNPSHWC
jgi:hypothetical protein